MVGSVQTKPNSNAHKGNTLTNHINAVQREGRGEGRRKTSDGLLHFGHRPIYTNPKTQKLNYAHRQTNKIRHTNNKTDSQTNKNKKGEADQTVTPR